MSFITVGTTDIPYMGRSWFSPCKIGRDVDERTLTWHERLALAFVRSLYGEWDDFLGPKPDGYDLAYNSKNFDLFGAIMKRYHYALFVLNCPVEYIGQRFVPYDPSEITKTVTRIAWQSYQDPELYDQGSAK